MDVYPCYPCVFTPPRLKQAEIDAANAEHRYYAVIEDEHKAENLLVEYSLADLFDAMADYGEYLPHEHTKDENCDFRYGPVGIDVKCKQITVEHDQVRHVYISEMSEKQDCDLYVFAGVQRKKNDRAFIFGCITKKDFYKHATYVNARHSDRAYKHVFKTGAWKLDRKHLTRIDKYTDVLERLRAECEASGGRIDYTSTHNALAARRRSDISFHQYAIRKDQTKEINARLCEEKDDIHFYLLTGEYTYVKKAGLTINLTGNLDDSFGYAPVNVQMRGFNPHCYLRKPKEWTDDHIRAYLKVVDKALRTAAKMQDKADMRNVLEERDALILGYQLVRGEHLMGVEDEPLDDYVDMYFAHPKLVKIFKDLIYHPKGNHETVNGNQIQTIPHWCPKELRKVTNRLQVYEADVDFIVRMLVDTRFRPCTWFKLPAGKYSIIAPEHWQRWSTCDLEVSIDYRDILPTSEGKYKTLEPDFNVLTFDIECETTGKRFPDHNIDPCLQVGCVLWSYLDEKIVKRHMFTLKDIEKLDDFDEIFCFDNEKDMFVALHNYFEHTDPDIWSHHNGNGFDINYLKNRAKVLGIGNFAKLTRCKWKEVFTTKTTNKGFDKWSAHNAGRLNFDIFRKAQEDNKLEEHNLNFLALQYLEGDTKEEIHYSMISEYQKTKMGRTRMAKYCMKDSRLVERIMKKKKWVPATLSMAARNHVMPQISLDRAQGAKMECLLRIGAIADEYPKLKISKRPYEYDRARINQNGKREKSDDDENEPRKKKKVEYDEEDAEYMLEDWEDEQEPEDEHVDKDLLVPDVEAATKGSRGMFVSVKTLVKEGLVDDDSYQGATVLQPKCGYYEKDIVATLDFSGMYPSIMMERNLCYSTLIDEQRAIRKGYKRSWRDPETGKIVDEDYWKLTDFQIVEKTREDGTKYNVIEDVEIPNAPCFLTPRIKKGVIPKIQEELKSERKKIKDEMEVVERQIEVLQSEIGLDVVYSKLADKNKEFSTTKKAVDAMVEKGYANDDPQLVSARKRIADVQADIKELKAKEMSLLQTDKGKVIKALKYDYGNLDIAQLIVKLNQNGTYGLTGDKTSQFYCKEIATTVTACGRRMIATIKLEAEQTFSRQNGYWFDADVIYGDTDSIFVLLRNFCVDVNDVYSRAEACSLGTIMADYITKKHFRAPISLEFEKIYTNLNMIGPKNYYGCKWLVNQIAPKLDVKGLQMIKRGPCTFIKDSCKTAVTIMCMENDYDKAMAYAASRFDMLNARKVRICDLIERQKISQDLDSYSKVTTYQDKNSLIMKTKRSGESPYVTLAKRKRLEDPMNKASVGDIISAIVVDMDPVQLLERETKIRRDNENARSEEQRRMFEAQMKKIGEERQKAIAQEQKERAARLREGKKLKKGDFVEDPLTVMMEELPINYEYYRRGLERQLAKVLGNAVLNRFPMSSYTVALDNKTIKKEEVLVSEARQLKKEKDALKKQIEKKREVTSRTNVAGMELIRTLQSQFDEKKSKLSRVNLQIATFKKETKRKVLSEVTKQCKKARRTAPVQEGKGIAKFFKKKPECLLCRSILHDPHLLGNAPCPVCKGELGKCSHRASGKCKDVCQLCHSMMDNLLTKAEDKMTKLKKEETVLNETCLKCMSVTDIDETRKCVNVICKTLGDRRLNAKKIVSQTEKLQMLKRVDW
jgi:DNA polymerase elongation subunit (family B)